MFPVSEFCFVSGGRNSYHFEWPTGWSLGQREIRPEVLKPRVGESDLGGGFQSLHRLLCCYMTEEGPRQS